MKKNIVFAFSLLLLSSALYAGHHEKNPIIFYLDLDIAEGKAEGVEEFIDYLVTTVEKTEAQNYVLQVLDFCRSEKSVFNGSLSFK